jgi:hypothetical protein
MATMAIVNKVLKETKLYYYQVNHSFMASTNFSESLLPLTPNINGVLNFVYLSSLLYHDKLDKLLHDWKPKLDEALATAWTFDTTQSETSMNMDIRDLVKPLCKEFFMENDSIEVKKGGGFECKPLGMGSQDTWHGSPDMRATIYHASMTDCFHLPVEEVKNEVENEVQSEDCDPGYYLYLEGKKCMLVDRDKVLSQVVVATVVSSFTHHKIHADVTSVPVLLVCKRRVRVCIYDCIQDILLISSITPLLSDGKLDPMGLLLIWIILHWRYV